MVEKTVADLASRGYRALAVARSGDSGKSWALLGILPMFDPPRDDSRATIERAEAKGVRVKMVTGDDTAIAREIARQLGLGTNIIPAAEAFPPHMSPEYVRPYIKAQKNDDRDAEGIAEAATRPTMRFVEMKTEDQLDMQTLHRRENGWSVNERP